MKFLDRGPRSSCITLQRQFHPILHISFHRDDWSNRSGDPRPPQNRRTLGPGNVSSQAARSLTIVYLPSLQGEGFDGIEIAISPVKNLLSPTPRVLSIGPGSEPEVGTKLRYAGPPTRRFTAAPAIASKSLQAFVMWQC
jgi:hypothetical protein